MNFVLLGELFGEGNAQLVEIAESILYDLRAGSVAEEKGGFGVLDRLGCFFVEGTFAARIAGFSGVLLAFKLQLLVDVGEHTFVATSWCWCCL